MIWYILIILFILLLLFFSGISRLMKWSDRQSWIKPDRLTDEQWQEVLKGREERQAYRDRL